MMFFRFYVCKLTNAYLEVFPFGMNKSEIAPQVLLYKFKKLIKLRNCKKTMPQIYKPKKIIMNRNYFLKKSD